jgi:transposase
MVNLEYLNQRNFFDSDVTLSHVLEEGDLCFLIKNEVACRIKDSDFEAMYKDGGRPPISPRLLVLVILMQFLESLSDRAAIQNLKFRLDWKIVFGLPVDFIGFHPTVLTYFRERLVANLKASYVFD